MVESKTKFEEIRKWVSDHKLRTVGCLWLSGITGSIAYNWSQPAMKTSVKITWRESSNQKDFKTFPFVFVYCLDQTKFLFLLVHCE
ncbi:hypothetical protein ISN45_Aa03g005680 [Arabidopsis thaliana x Arabidopsis arenosa]|uniref:HIG1 domain-containing protein n=1 Tax=Arabidopsis thaliana x Arabidopsis arenosa TaxID=1240361 RepID=A0A8T2APQ0_9BRAS|nr:hypothetical protein ISN45_Aa03g005680 [Arabidopsis thaliana x Arabidopsis arenosa]KAG7576141.1 hypothetical protein ISN45_Aa03g005680 [Arabidopsis thaliana x Arabidopsis arenosa]